MQLGIFLGVALSFVLIDGAGSSEHSDNPILCVVTSPLVTPYFTPWLDTPCKAHGCWADSDHSPSQEVHVLLLHGLDSSRHGHRQSVTVTLTRALGNVSGKEVMGRLALVLSADRPIAWQLRTSYNDLLDENDDDDLYTLQPFVVVSEGSTVEANFRLNQSHWTWTSKHELQLYVKHHFPALASFTEVQGANHISLSTGIPAGQCDVHSQAESRVVSASQSVQLESAGCFHENYIGDNPMDVYVVELDAGGRGNRPNRGPLPVLVQLLGESSRPVSRNVTLVLKSHQPVRWQFSPTTGLLGNIMVVSDHEDQVENSGPQQLEVRSKLLPDSLDALLLSVTTEFGPPILYAKTGRASTLRLLLGTKSKAGLRSGPEEQALDQFPGQDLDVEDSHELMQQQPNYPGSALISGFAAQEPHTMPVGQLKAAMIVQCEKTRIVVSFPLSMIHQLGVSHISFNDATCAMQYNTTHAMLVSHITSCGTTSENNGKLILFSNTVHVKFGPGESDDEDFEASGSSGDGLDSDRIPVVCRYQPHFPGDKFEIGEDDSFLDSVDMSSGSSNSLYHLELYRDKQHTQRIGLKGLNSAVPDAEFDETLFVKAWMDGVVPVQVVTENCWLSNSSDAKHRARMVLLRNACPVDLSVQIQHNNQTIHGSFSFQVSREYESMGRLYLHCRLGVCTQDPGKAKGNLVLCVDPKKYCSSTSLRPYLDKAVSTAQQLATVGPFKAVPRRRKLSNMLVVPSPAPPKEVHTKVVYVGVSTEVTVGIALASFAIGVGLTGTLWCIHMRTDPFRRQCDKQGQRAGAIGAPGASCNLSPHSGCSSTNSQVAMTT